MASGHGVDKPHRENDPKRKVERGAYGQELEGWQANAAIQKSSGTGDYPAFMRSIGMGHMVPPAAVPNTDYTSGIPHPVQEEEDRTDYEQIHMDRLERRRPEGDTW